MPARCAVLLLLLSSLVLLAPSRAGSVRMQCPSAIDPKYIIYDECARLCLGCHDVSYTFGHNCEPTSTCCLSQGQGVFLNVFGCVKQNCTEATSAQSQWELFLSVCEQNHLPVDSSLTPPGYTYRSSSSGASTSDTDGQSTTASRTSAASSTVSSRSSAASRTVSSGGWTLTSTGTSTPEDTAADANKAGHAALPAIIVPSIVAPLLVLAFALFCLRHKKKMCFRRRRHVQLDRDGQPTSKPLQSTLGRPPQIISSAGGSSSSETMPTSGSSGGFFDVQTSELTDSQCQQADAWYRDKLRPCWDRITRSRADNGLGAVKIAVLDTVFHLNHPALATLREGPGVKGKIKYTDRGEKGIPGQWSHGSQVAALVNSVVGEAELFLETVMPDSRGPQPRLIADAIKKAIDMWRVDIIVMSFGFSHPDDEVDQAIADAKRANILIFAAASNQGANNDIAYPARKTDSVFAVYSTDATGRRSNFSPPLNGEATVIATVGEAVNPIGWYTGTPVDPGSRCSGTSFSTALAAGIAGMVLQYAYWDYSSPSSSNNPSSSTSTSRVDDRRGRLNAQDIKALRTLMGMTAVLKLMVPGTRDPMCLGYLRPWDLFCEGEEGSPDEISRRIKLALSRLRPRNGTQLV